ncbi:hypothetical protein VFPPC_02633 [Pochonia chlamydosporia 170]|uniref:Uncharacterized protein n=1 Tax=Pochonia chlamydosporia 170 TaxID=1380566 RepID=A0A179FYH8_METCM|nr:hypothetical protein VFPPC_02633 [Pochonia chlamydosporia 170]OAQ70103.2 hypothetical protein VFPPC_02633 [Pochonia chlamydosporia 170]
MRSSHGQLIGFDESLPLLHRFGYLPRTEGRSRSGLMAYGCVAFHSCSWQIQNATCGGKLDRRLFQLRPLSRNHRHSGS